MFKDYVVVDNFFDDPFKVCKKFQSIQYYSNEHELLPDINLVEKDSGHPSGFWRGYRSKPLHIIDKILFHEIFFNMTKVFENARFQWNADIYFHITTKTINDFENWWHRDNQILAGVIYMNETPDPDSGTLLDVNGCHVNIENKFNRLAFYRGDLLHRPNKMVGDNMNTARKTINIFVEKITFI